MPPIECLVDLPLSDGEEIPGVRDQFTLEAVEEHDEQIDHEGESSA